MSVIWNVKSHLEKEKGKKYKVITIRCLDDKLKEFQKILGIENINPKRPKKGNLLKDIDILNLPDYKNEESPYETNPQYKFTIISDEDRKELSRLLKMDITSKTRSICYPQRPVHKLNNMMYITDEPVQSTYPIYILSKGRSESRYTVKTLEEMKVNYKIVIEPQEFKDYNKYIHKDKILILPNEYLNKNQGGIPARNFIWQHSINSGFKWHWIIDDNIEGFFRWNENKKLPIKSGICFKMIEDYVQNFANVAMAGLQYSSFYPEISLNRPLYLKNTRIYSCILIKNDIKLDERWRGKYNEDTDLSLRCLKKGYSTLLFQNFLCGKKTTLSVKGGNSQIYSGDGLQQKLDSLIAQHPDCVKGTFKFKKVHHQVDYSSFKNNKLMKKEKVIIPKYTSIKLVKTETLDDETDEEEDEEEEEEIELEEIETDDEININIMKEDEEDIINENILRLSIELQKNIQRLQELKKMKKS